MQTLSCRRNIRKTAAGLVSLLGLKRLNIVRATATTAPRATPAICRTPLVLVPGS